MTALPEAVEQAIHAADETNTRIAEAANGSDLTDLYTEWREALTALRAAILAYGAARERQGIERAAAVPSTMAAERQAMVDQRRQRFDRDDGLTLQIESEGHTMAGLAKAIRALPVDGADTETQARKEVPAVRPQIGDPPMTRLVPRPDWTPVEFVLAVRAAVWEQGVTPETAANRPTVLALFRPAEEPGIITATADHARPLEPIPWDDDYPRETPRSRRATPSGGAEGVASETAQASRLDPDADLQRGKGSLGQRRESRTDAGPRGEQRGRC